MKVLETKFHGVLIIEPKVYEDDRGYFFENWNLLNYADSLLNKSFVQDNVSFSKRGVLRGLHFQNPKPQGKLVTVLAGEVFDVVVDIRNGSSTFGEWFAVTLSGDNKRQLYIPEGFAHGFLAISDNTLFYYKCTEYYSPVDELSILWDDEDIGIEWPINSPILSNKDLQAPLLKEIPKQKLFKY